MRESLESARTVAALQLGLDDLPVVDLDIGELGGPSAGLAFALTLADVLTDGDLTGGRTIAATGQLGADGEVQAVGRVAEKAAPHSEQARTSSSCPSPTPARPPRRHPHSR